MNWRIWYEDGTVFSSTDGPPEKSPAWGVLGIWQRGRSLYNKDFYIWREDYQSWVEVDQIGLVDHLVTAAPQITAVKVGRTVPWKTYRHVLDVIRDVKV
jgi:hypothetical protein